MWTRLRRNLRKKTRSLPVPLRMETLEDRSVPSAFTAGNLVLYRVGDGTGSLVNTGNAVFLDEFTPEGKLVQSIAMPTKADGSNNAFYASGTATSEGMLTLSADGRYLVLTGYANTYTSTLPGTSSATIARVIGRVAADGTINTTTTTTSFSGNNIRGAASTNGTDLWAVGGNSGVVYTTLGGSGAGTGVSSGTSTNNFRVVQIFDGQLYVSTMSGTSIRLGTVGTGTPTTSGQTVTNLAGFPTSTGSYYGFFFADLNEKVTGVDTLYVADDTANQIQKYSLVDSKWAANGTITLSSVRGLTGLVDEKGIVSLFATNGSALSLLVDETGYNATIKGDVQTIAKAETNTAFRGVAFVPTNNAPILKGANDFGAIDEDATSNAGTLVADLIKGQVSDPDDEKSKDAKRGIAITALDTSNGAWQYTLDGKEWIDIKEVNEKESLLLPADATTALRFVPNANFNGTIKEAITFRAWDQFSGVAGGVANTTENGGITAFSTEIARANITVNAINDAPVLTGTNNFSAINEDNSASAGTLVSDLLKGKASDVDSGARQGLALTAVDTTNGTWQYTLDGKTWTDIKTVSGKESILLASDSTTALRFIPKANFNGTVSKGITFRAWDQTSGEAGKTADTSTNGGTTAFSSATADASITVNAVNDAPVLSGANGTGPVREDQTDSEGVLVSDFLATRVTDVDTGAKQGIAIIAIDTTNGVVQFALDGTTWQDVGKVSESEALLLAADATTRLRFVPKANFNGLASSVITVRAWDQTSGEAGKTANVSTNGGTTAFSSATASSNVFVISIADTPSVTNATTNEDTQTTSGLVITRSPVDGEEVNFFHITNITNGSVFLADGTTPVADGDFVIFDGNALTLRFTPAPGFFGTGSFQIQASGGDASVGGDIITATIIVNPVADTPSVTNATTTPNTQTTSGLVVSRNTADGSEVTHFQITNITNGTLFLNDGATAIGNGNFITFAQANAGLKFTPSTNFTGAATFQVQASVSDSTGGLGGDKVTATITVSPELTPSVTNAITDEDVRSLGGLVITPNAADGGATQFYKVTGITNGALFLADGITSVNNGDFISVADGAAGLRFLPGSNFFGAGSFVVRGSTSNTDAGLGGSPVTATITVNPVADTPTITSASTTEDIQTTGGLVVSRNAADGSEVTHFQVTGITGGLLFQSDGTTRVNVGEFITFAQANAGLLFTPNGDQNDATGTFTVELRASIDATPAGLGGVAGTGTIAVAPVNDEPSALLTGDVTVGEGSGTFTQDDFVGTFSPGGGVDEDGQTPTYLLSNTNNALFSTQPTIDSNGTLTFTLAPGANGSAVVTVIVMDNGGLNNGGDDTGEDRTFTITVTPAPVTPPTPPITIAASAQFIAIGSDVGTQSRVRVLSATTGALVADFSPLPGYFGGIRVAVADMNGDGTDDLIMATASGFGAFGILDLRTGGIINASLPFGMFPSGLQITTGDVDGDGRKDLIVGLDRGPALVGVLSGATMQVIRAFDAFPGFAGGVRLATGDVNGDGKADIGVAAGPGGLGFVAVFDGATGNRTSFFSMLPGFTGELNLAMGDITGDGKAEIVGAVTVPQGTIVGAFTPQGELVRSFFAPAAIGSTFSAQRNDQVAVTAIQSARVALGDITGDGIADFLLSDPPGTGSSRLLMLNGATGAMISNPFAFDPLFGFGIYVDL